MRLDGFFCDYKSEEKFDFLRTLYTKGVRNIEMESTCFASMTYRAGVKGKNIVGMVLIEELMSRLIKMVSRCT